MRYCIGVPEDLWVLSLYVLSVLMVSSGFLPQSRDIQDRWTGDCSECEYECVWWTGHLSRGFPAYDPGKAPASWPYIGQALGKMYGIDGWMFSTVMVLVLPLSATLFPHQCVFPDPCFQTKSFQSHPFIKRWPKKKERRWRRLKIGHLAWLSTEIAFSCVWNNYYSIS